MPYRQITWNYRIRGERRGGGLWSSPRPTGYGACSATANTTLALATGLPTTPTPPSAEARGGPAPGTPAPGPNQSPPPAPAAQSPGTPPGSRVGVGGAPAPQVRPHTTP